MEDKYLKDGFIMDLWEGIFNFLSKISLFYWVRKCLGNRIKKKYTFVESWVVGNLMVSIIFSFLAYNSKSKVLLYIILICAISRVFEIIIYQLNVMLFDPYRAQKKGESIQSKISCKNASTFTSQLY